jgi:hypothetical protein
MGSKHVYPKQMHIKCKGTNFFEQRNETVRLFASNTSRKSATWTVVVGKCIRVWLEGKGM